jgi:ribonuclease HI
VTPPPCIIGKVRRVAEYDQLELESLSGIIPDTLIATVSSAQLVEHLCKVRTVFSFTLDGVHDQQVECLVPLSAVIPHTFQEDYIIVQTFTPSNSSTAPPLAALGLSFIRDCLLANGCDTLREACTRPPWLVSRADLHEWFTPSRPATNHDGTKWHLSEHQGLSQTYMTMLVQGVKQRRAVSVHRPLSPLHPWQSDPPLPNHVTIDLSHHHPKQMHCPQDWEVMQRNGRVWIVRKGMCPVSLDAAQYGMLINLHSQLSNDGPSVVILHQITVTCLAQRQADLQHHVQWSRHFLACLQRSTGATLLIGASAVTYNPHFRYFSSPVPGDSEFGAVQVWPPEPALLLLDSFAPESRQLVLQSAASHEAEIWILRQDHKNESALRDLNVLRGLGCTLCALIPARSRVLHGDGCWAEAKWDVIPSRSVTQLWKLCTKKVSDLHRIQLQPLAVQQALGHWEQNRYDFHWCEDPIPRALVLHRQHQQDALRFSWPGDGLVAGTDGGVQWKQERMAAGYVAGTDLIPLMTLSAPVGGPLASLRAEGASLLHFVHKAAEKYGRHIHLLVFIDCLILLDILHKWGRSNFHPRPKDIAHFDVILPLLHELRQWHGRVALVKVKSHTGCLLNERADECAELGYTSDHDILCPGPDKYGSLWLRIRPNVRDLTKDHRQQLQSDRAPNKRILEKVIAANNLRAVKLRGTIFAKDILHCDDGETILRIVSRCSDAEYRTWLKTVTGIYPVQSYLCRIGKADSNICPHCDQGVPETFTHFVSVCPKFHDARTAAHNQVRSVISAFLHKHRQPGWTIHEETRMDATGLTLRPVSSASMAQAGRRLSEAEQAAGLVSIARLGRLQPDFVAFSSADKSIAILDLCRPSDVHADQLATAYSRKNASYAPLADALYYYHTEGWEIKVLPLVIGVRGLVNVRHIHETFTFLKIPRKEWLNGLECFALASVKALSFLHRIRYAARSADVQNTGYHDDSTSDHADDNDHGADTDSGDSADEAIVVSTLCRGDNTKPPVSSLPALTQPAGLCPTARNSQKRKYTCESDLTEQARASMSFPVAALEEDSMRSTTRRHRSQKSNRRVKSSVVTAIRGKRGQLKTSRATVTTSKQLRFRPCLADQLQFKTFDTNDPVIPFDTVQRYPPGYDSTKWNQWKHMERTGRGQK